MCILNNSLGSQIIEMIEHLQDIYKDTLSQICQDPKWKLMGVSVTILDNRIMHMNEG